MTLVVASVVGPSAVIGLVIIHDTKQFQTGQTEEKFAVVLQGAKREVHYWNRERKSELEMLVNSNGLVTPLDRHLGATGPQQSEASIEIKRFFEIVSEKMPQYEQFVVAGSDGQRIASSGIVSRETMTELQSLLAQSSGQFHRSAPQTDGATGRFYQWYLVPVDTPDGRHVMVCVKTGLDDLTLVLSAENFPDVDDLYIVDATGRLLTRPRIAQSHADQAGGVVDDDIRRITMPSVPERPRSVQPIVIVTHAEGDGRARRKVLAGAAQEPITSWWIVCEAAEGRMLGPVVAWKNRMLIVVGIICPLFLLGAWKMSRNLLESLSQLRLGAKRINQGLVGVKIPVKRVDEIGEMITAFNEMAERIALDDARLKRSNVELKRTNDELKVANDKLGELSVTDGLTGLFNHRHFWDLMDSEIRRATRSGKPLSLVIMDVDNFKDVNDRFGHSTGDRLIRKIASVVKGTVRDTDVAARYGGEEFTVLLPDTDRRGALKVSEKLRRAVETTVFEVPGSDAVISTTVSVGVSLYAGDRNAFFNAADEALYASKSAGKNRVTFAESNGELVSQRTSET
jgi:diguanylate cyclase (GGDEF)-like protein